MRINRWITPEELDGLRAIATPGISDQELLRSVSEALSAMTPEQAEGFLDDVVKKALPGAIQGAITGSAAGPYGALGGAALGILGALSGGQKTPQVPPQAPPQPPAQPLMPQIPTAVAGVAQTPAAAQLLQLINSPELQKALLSLILGTAGSQTLPVGGKQVPTADFTNTLGVLAQKASKEAAEAYAEGSAETYIPAELDPANPEDRAEALMGLLQRQGELRNIAEEDFSELFSENRPLFLDLG